MSISTLIKSSKTKTIIDCTREIRAIIANRLNHNDSKLKRMMKTTILLILVWLATVSANSLRHESSVGLALKGTERGGKVKVRMLKKDDSDDTDESEDHDERDDRDDRDDRDSKSDKECDDCHDGSSETRAHRDGRDRGSFCNDIHIVDEDHHCADDVKDAVDDHFFDATIHMDGDCDEADANEDVCLEISDSDDCDEVVNDSLDELEEWCSNGSRSGVNQGGGNAPPVIVVAPPEPEHVPCFSETEKTFSMVTMQYHCSDLILVEQGNTCIVSGHLGEDTTIRVSGCSDIILTDGDRSCPCADVIRAALLEEYIDAVIHMRSYCSDADSMICHKMSHSSDCELAKSLALMDMESRCGTTDNKSQSGYDEVFYVDEADSSWNHE
ncbi:hypothetical protein ACHAWU_005880 [Discostella pseudostelligera]|uniref:Uncharacterized protein n=1 Tax=Discostella pseudostelligera TaxID=259834 RepID=A0ABD3N1U4_9STRA